MTWVTYWPSLHGHCRLPWLCPWSQGPDTQMASLGPGPRSYLTMPHWPPLASILWPPAASILWPSTASILNTLASRGLDTLAFHGLNTLAFHGLNTLAFPGLGPQGLPRPWPSTASALKPSAALAFHGHSPLAFFGLGPPVSPTDPPWASRGPVRLFPTIFFFFFCALPWDTYPWLGSWVLPAVRPFSLSLLGRYAEPLPRCHGSSAAVPPASANSRRRGALEVKRLVDHRYPRRRPPSSRRDVDCDGFTNRSQDGTRAPVCREPRIAPAHARHAHPTLTLVLSWPSPLIIT